MRRRMIFGVLLVCAMLLCAFAQAESKPVTGEEIQALADKVIALAKGGELLNDPASPEALSEDGYALQYDFGMLYADRPELAEETRVNTLLILDNEMETLRGITIDYVVNRVMEEIPCDNPEMNGTYEEALLYLTGDAESGYLYGRVERDGQRIFAMEYGAADPQAGTRRSVTFGISGDGVNDIRIEGLGQAFSAADAKDLYTQLSALAGVYEYSRVPRSLVGTELEMFQEADLDFSALSYQTAEPAIFGDNVEGMLIDNEDGTWLYRVDGDGFEAVFNCDANGKNTTIRSYSILSPELEGPRGVRLGDYFHEDFTRFRSGEGALSEDGTMEVLYGAVGTAPYGVAEYGDGSEMALRYVTGTLSGPKVELLLRYEDTVLTEMILHTLEEDE